MPAGNYIVDDNYNKFNRLQIVRGGKPYFELLTALINGAVSSIHLQTYIFANDETGMQIAAALRAAAQRNVQVYLLADGYASQAITQRFIDGLRAAGVHFRFFEPLFKSGHFYIGRRMHHKLFVADEKVALVGGINIANHYNDLPGQPAWLDFALLAEGEIVQELYVLCWKTWNGFSNKISLFSFKEIQREECQETGTIEVRMRRNDWVRRKNQISTTYIELFRTATSNITILCSYFLPGRLIRRLLKHAARRGVKITIITAGRSDVPVAKHAERWLYDWLLRHNITIYEYQPVVLHAKIAVCDDKWFTLGSYNVNNISAYASIEVNLDVRDVNFTGSVINILEDIRLHDCVKIDLKKHKAARNIFNQFVRWFSYQFIRIVFYLFTFYFKRQSVKRVAPL